MNKKVKKTATTACITALTMTSFFGCGEQNKKYVLANTMLDKVMVAKVDGEIEFLRPAIGKTHTHYENIITGLLLTDYDSCAASNINKVETIEPAGSLLSLLTTEQLQKASADTLTTEDIVDIVSRIANEQREEVAVKSKK